MGKFVQQLSTVKVAVGREGEGVAQEAEERLCAGAIHVSLLHQRKAWGVVVAGANVLQTGGSMVTIRAMVRVSVEACTRGLRNGKPLENLVTLEILLVSEL